MSSFTSSLVVSPMSNGKDWRLVFPFTFHIGSKYSNKFVRVTKDFISDFASIPRFLWFLPYWAKFNKAPILHDWLYKTKKIMGKPITRKEADLVFLEAMLVDWRNHKSRHIMAFIEYRAVRIFGFLAWREDVK